MQLNRLDKLPEGFLAWSPDSLARKLVGPTLIHLEGQNKAPLFISILLHGNEVSGLTILQKLFSSLDKLPRSIDLFIGNTLAVGEGLRVLPGQKDFNRIWGGGEGQEYDLANEVLKIARSRRPWACVDIHNNTGKNPLYACINRREQSFFSLASLFSDDIVFFEEPHEVLSIAFSKICPSVTLECGQPNEPEGVQRTVQYLQKLLPIDDLSSIDVSHQTQLYHTVARLLISPSVDVDFLGQSSIDISKLSLRSDIDALNFQRLPPKTQLGHSANSASLFVIDNEGDDVTQKFLDYEYGKIQCVRDVIPAMLTQNLEVARQDCLGYLMEPIGI